MELILYTKFLLILLFIKNFVFAAPACPENFVVEQPYGTKFYAHNVGDEWCNWTETEEGYPVVKNKKTSFWEYAKIEYMKGLVPSGLIVGKNLPVDIKKISYKELKSSIINVDNKEQIFFAKSFFTKSVSKTPPLLGTRKIITILVNFADRPLSTTETDWYEVFFGTTNSLKKFYEEVSYNQLVFVPAQETYGIQDNGIVIVSLPYNHPNVWYNVNDWHNQQIVKDAVIAADQFVNFADFDTDRNGKITTDELHVCVIAAGFERCYAALEPAVWGHRLTMLSIEPPVVDGVKVCSYPGGYTLFGELHGSHQATIGIIIHEFGHDLGTNTSYFGLPDLYDSDKSSLGVGRWCSMGYGFWCGKTYPGDTPAHFCAWCKWYLGWVTPQQINVDTYNVLFPQVETSTSPDRGIKQLLDNPNGPEYAGKTGEYFLIENRQKIGYDARLPESGLLVWHIDESQYDNDNETRKLVDLEEADGLDQLDKKISDGDEGDPYYLGNNTVFDDTSYPNSKLYDGSPSNISVYNISESGPIMTANIKFVSSLVQEREGYITGKVVSAVDNSVLSGTIVEVYKDNSVKYTTTCDIDGNYLIKVATDTYSVRVSTTGYETKVLDSIVVIHNSTTTLNFVLNDISSPTVKIVYPNDNSVINYISTISGTVTDFGSGISNVKLLIKQLRDNSYWNGENWSTQEIFVIPSLQSNLWLYTGLNKTYLNNGASYYVLVLATDYAGNSNTESIIFSYIYITRYNNKDILKEKL